MNDELKIKPQLQTVRIDHEWVDSLDKNRWAKIIALHLQDTLHKEGLFKMRSREIGKTKSSVKHLFK